MPFVTNVRRVFFDVILSKRIEYPTSELGVPIAPGGSPNSRETRCASEMAEIRRGSVQYILQCLPFESWSSNIYVGTCVDLPLDRRYQQSQAAGQGKPTSQFRHSGRVSASSPTLRVFHLYALRLEASCVDADKVSELIG
jgi:hypothetical protein